MKRAAFSGLLLVGALTTSVALKAAPPTRAWVAPSEVRVLAAQAKAGTAAPRRVDPREQVLLEPGAMLLFPVSPGDPIRVEGHLLDVGLGTGVGEYPDAVTWLPQDAPADVRELVVPTFGTARFALIRITGSTATRVRPLIAAPRRRLLSYYRADEAIDAWLAGRAPLPNWDGELGELGPALRLLQALRSAFGEDAGDPGVRAWLQARWLELALGVRPLDAPFAFPVPVVGQGGRPVPSNDQAALGLDDAFEHRLLDGGHRLELRSDRARIVTLLVRPRAVGRSVTRVLEGDTLREAIEVKIPRRAEEAARWAAARVVRAPISPGKPLAVEIDRGDALVSFRGYRQRTGLLAPLDLRDRTGLLERAGSARTTRSGPLLARLADFALTRSATAALRLADFARQPTLPAGLRAIAWHELATHGLASAPPGFEPLHELLVLAQGLAEEVALPLARSALELAVARGDRLPRGSLAALVPGPTPAREDEDTVVAAALAEIVAAPADRERPRYGALVDDLISRGSPRDDLRDVAHRVWLEAGLWTWSEPADGSGVVTKLRPVYDTLPGEACDVEAPEGLRWTFVDHSPLDVSIAPGPGTHAWVPARAEREELVPESLLAVDEVRLGVHGGAGLTSTLALSPGAHRLLVESGSPVLVRLPLARPMPCARLREVERWVYVAKTARFALAAPGQPGAVSIILDRETMAGAGRALTVRSEGVSYTGFIGAAATGELELPASSTASEVEVEVDRPTLLRVRQRLHPPGGGPRVVRPTGEPARNFEQALESLRQATRFLRLADGREGRVRLRLERASALDALGYPRLAALDRLRAGVAPEDPVAAQAAKGAEYLELPEGSPGVVPLNHLAKIAPLPLPADSKRLAAALGVQARGEPARAVLEALGGSADASSVADALLLAVRSEELGEISVAQAAYQRIGEASSSGEALAQASLLMTDRSVAEQAPALAVRAYALARQAEALGYPAAATLGRVDQALSWQRASFDAAAGIAWIEHARIVSKDRSPSDRVKSALVDAPDITPLFSGPELRLGLDRTIGKSLDLVALCHALEGQKEDCSYRLLLDGKPARCEPVDTPVPSDGVARPTRCRIDLPLDAQRLVVQTPEGAQTTGFVDVKRVLGGEALPLTVVGRWYEIAPERPAHLAVLGPTVLRLALRGYDASAPPLTASVKSLKEPGLTREDTLALDATIDAYARRADTKAAVTKEAVGYVTVPFDGPAVVTFSAKGRLLANVEYAVVTGLPRARATPKTVPVPVPRQVVPQARPKPRPLLVGADRPVGPFTLRAYVSTITTQVNRGATDLSETELDRSASYTELGAEALRALVPDRLWVEGGLFSRARPGPTTLGASAALSVSPDGLIPGGFLRGRYAIQPSAEGARSGGIAMAGVLNQIDLDPSLYLSPLAAVVTRNTAAADELAAAADPDIYTLYDASNPWSFDFGLYASQRSTVDLLLRYGGLVRYLSNFGGVDKVDWSARARLLAGDGLTPGAELAAVASWRPEGPARRYGFWRASVEPALLFWQWFGDERLTGRAAVAYVADLPPWAGRGAELIARVTVASEFTLGRGLADVMPVDKPFSERQAEGADVPVRAPPPTDAYWVEP